jgi:hypothetical protein
MPPNLPTEGTKSKGIKILVEKLPKKKDVNMLSFRFLGQKTL